MNNAQKNAYDMSSNSSMITYALNDLDKNILFVQNINYHLNTLKNHINLSDQEIEKENAKEILSQSFFDKMIQLPFRMPVAYYKLDSMIERLLSFLQGNEIISDKYEKIAQEVGKKIERGSTGIYAKGMYTNEEKMTLLCVGSRTESYVIESIAKKVDRTSFIIILNYTSHYSYVKEKIAKLYGFRTILKGLP